MWAWVVSSTIEATRILNRSGARSAPRVAVFHVLKESHEKHAGAVHRMFKAIGELVVEDGAILWVSKGNRGFCWVRALLLAHRGFPSSFWASDKCSVVEPEATTTGTVGSAYSNATSASRRWLKHHGMTIDANKKE
jgi:hypothetical protein